MKCCKNAQLGYLTSYPALISSLAFFSSTSFSDNSPNTSTSSFAYLGLTMYESVVKGMPGYQSVASPRIGTDINALLTSDKQSKLDDR